MASTISGNLFNFKVLTGATACDDFTAETIVKENLRFRCSTGNVYPVGHEIGNGPLSDTTVLIRGNNQAVSVQIDNWNATGCPYLSIQYDPDGVTTDTLSSWLLYTQGNGSNLDFVSNIGPIDNNIDFTFLAQSDRYFSLPGCMDDSACNYDENFSMIPGCGGLNPGVDCDYAEENYDCDGNCIVEIDCAGFCGGTAVLNTCGTCTAAGGENTNDDLNCPDTSGNVGCSNLPTGCQNGTCCDCIGTNQTLWYHDNDGDGLAGNTTAYYCDPEHTEFFNSDILFNEPGGWYSVSSDLDDDCKSNQYDFCGICTDNNNCIEGQPDDCDQMDCNGTCFGTASDNNNCNTCMGGLEEPASLLECVPDCLGTYYVPQLQNPVHSVDCMGICESPIGPNAVDANGTCCLFESILPHWLDTDGDGLGDIGPSIDYCAGMAPYSDEGVYVPNNIYIDITDETDAAYEEGYEDALLSMENPIDFIQKGSWNFIAFNLPPRETLQCAGTYGLSIEADASCDEKQEGDSCSGPLDDSTEETITGICAQYEISRTLNSSMFNDEDLSNPYIFITGDVLYSSQFGGGNNYSAYWTYLNVGDDFGFWSGFENPPYFEIGKGYALKVNNENGYLKWQID
jgi:hypothetical protein